MAIADPMPVLTEAEQSACQAVLAESGAHVLVGSVVDMAGVGRAKSVPVRRAASFHVAGMGAAPTWNVFCIDNTIAVTARLGVVGDLRLRVDLTGCQCSGTVSPGPRRSSSTRTEDRWRAARGGGCAACRHGRRRPGWRCWSETNWSSYSPMPMVRHCRAGTGRPTGLARCSTMKGSWPTCLVVEQLHAEYGTGQYEVSLGPRGPLEAADSVVLAGGQVALRCRPR